MVNRCLGYKSFNGSSGNVNMFQFNILYKPATTNLASAIQGDDIVTTATSIGIQMRC